MGRVVAGTARRRRNPLNAAVSPAAAAGDPSAARGPSAPPRRRCAWAFDDKVALSKDLKRRGFAFVGPTIVESFMQAVGMRNDHERGCYRRREISPRSRDKRAGTHV